MSAQVNISQKNNFGQLSPEDVDKLYTQQSSEKNVKYFPQEFWNSECNRLSGIINDLLEENVELKYVVDQLKAQLYVLHSLPY
jgi:hypothetical protein